MKLKMITGTIATFLRELANHLSDGSVFFSKEGHIFFGGKHYTGIRDCTYEELVESINSNKLIPGGKYRITDYRTIYSHNQYDGENMVTYGRDGDNVVSTIEPLIVTAISKNKLDINALSELYPNDVIHYTVNTVKGYNRDEDNHKGTIIYRLDTINNNSVTEDWRNIKYPLFTFDINSIIAKNYNPSDRFTFGDIVKDGNKLLISRINKTTDVALTDREKSICFIDYDLMYFWGIKKDLYFANNSNKFVIKKLLYEELNSYPNTNRNIAKYFSETEWQKVPSTQLEKVILINNIFSKYQGINFGNTKNNIISSYGSLELTKSIINFKGNNNNIKTLKSYLNLISRNNINVNSSSLYLNRCNLNECRILFGTLMNSNINDIFSSFIIGQNLLSQNISNSLLSIYHCTIDYINDLVCKNSRILNSVIPYFNRSWLINSEFESNQNLLNVGIINSDIKIVSNIRYSIFINFKGIVNAFIPHNLVPYIALYTNNKKDGLLYMNIYHYSNTVKPDIEIIKRNTFELLDDTSSIIYDSSINDI